MKDFLVAAGVFVAVLGTVLGTMYLALHRVTDRQVANHSRMPEYGITTVRHDGHDFVVVRTGNGAAIIHHPGCKCRLTGGE